MKGLIEEFESATAAIAAIDEAIHKATDPLVVKKLVRCRIETLRARVRILIEMRIASANEMMQLEAA